MSEPNGDEPKVPVKMPEPGRLTFQCPHCKMAQSMPAPKGSISLGETYNVAVWTHESHTCSFCLRTLVPQLLQIQDAAMMWGVVELQKKSIIAPPPGMRVV